MGGCDGEIEVVGEGVDGLELEGGAGSVVLVRHGEEWVGAAVVCGDAGVAEAPFAVVAGVAGPEAGVGEGAAAVAEVAFLEARGGV